MSVPVAAALDLWFEEPPARSHPVVWFGRFLDRAGRHVPAEPPGRALAAGSLAWLSGAAATAAAAIVVEHLARRLRHPWAAVVRGVALWPLLSVRMLLAEVSAVETALADGTASGRAALSRIVSRQTAGLTDEEVRGAAVESLAENLSDSVVAPLCWYLVAGLPGAAVYRFANTADACWGYRTTRWQHAGRSAARADDLLNLGPSRLTAALLLGSVRRAGRTALRAEAGKTSSPNAGWPMAAMALRLDLRLSKRDHYDLHPQGSPPGPGSVPAAVRDARRAAVVAVACAATAEIVIRRHRGARP